MKLDFKSLAFGYSLKNGVSTPAWETALGQGAGYKLKSLSTIDELVKGMIYKAVAPKSVSFKKGRGGAVVNGDADNAALVIAAVFDKVFINEHQIHGGQFVMLIIKDDSEHHRGRLKLKYGLDNAYTNSEGIVIKNRDFQNAVSKQLDFAEDACWFVYDISVENQDVLRLRTIVVNKEGPMEYDDSTALHSAWEMLIDEDLKLRGEVDKAEKDDGGVEIVSKGVSDNLSIEQLSKILENMYNDPAPTGKAMTPMIFGFKYANVIETNKYSISAIISKTSVPISYEVEIKKGMNTYKAIQNKEYGLGFVLNEASDGVSEGIQYQTTFSSEYPLNRIVFGAPGTGKSFTLNKEMKELVADGGLFERVTFHPDYSYANFVGTYKPVPKGDEITYSYVAGPFIRTWIEAVKNAQEYNPQPYVLIIEEINRANVAAVFGDVFQLLDRDENGVSEYSIQTSKELRDYLARELNCSANEMAEIKIPNNMFIWATMNSADQGVFPMDTAFKRRWDFTYIGIDEAQKGIENYAFTIAGNILSWNKIRKAINRHLTELGINEDKLIGPYFISEKVLKDSAKFLESFKSKLLMYLFEDAAKQRKDKVFFDKNVKYSDICEKFDKDGIKVFHSDIWNELIKEDDTE